MLGSFNDVGGGALVSDMSKSGASEPEAPVTHNFGTVFVVMADQHQSIAAAAIVDGTSYVFVVHTNHR